MRQLLSLAIIAFSFSAFAQTAASTATNSTPNIGMNLLLLYQNSNQGNDPLAEDRNGFSIQEAEVLFSSDVDPYWRLNATLALHPEYDDSNLSLVPPEEPEREMHLEIEEAFAETLALPYVTVRLGKFRTALGKQNALHAHAYSFIDAPLIVSETLGHHGLSDVGASAAILLPVNWFSEITLQAISGKGEDLEYFNGSSANDFVGLMHLKNLWDLNQDLTFEFGLSGASGKNSFGSSTNIYGADLTFKWRPDGRRDKALIWSTEALQRDYITDFDKQKDAGFASWIQYQFASRWWVQARTEYVEAKNQDPTADHLHPENQKKNSALLAFVSSEFSTLRLQLDQIKRHGEEDENKVMVQFNYSIGAHPAHDY